MDVAKDILLVAQIEHIRAVDQLDAILSHPRPDAIMVGPYDLSGSMGLTGQFDHPDFVAVMARINEAVSYTHLDVYKRQHFPRSHDDDLEFFNLLGSTTKQHKASNNAYRMDFALKQQFIARIQTTAV